MTHKTKALTPEVVKALLHGKTSKGMTDEILINDPKYEGARSEIPQVAKKFMWACDVCNTEYVYRHDAEECQLKCSGAISEAVVELPEGEKVGDLKFTEPLTVVSCSLCPNVHIHYRDTISFVKVGAIRSELYVVPIERHSHYSVEDMHSIIWRESCAPAKQWVVKTRVTQVRYGRKQISTDFLGGSIVWSDVKA